MKTIQPSIFWAKLTYKINVVSIFEYTSIIHLEFILVYVRRNEPMLFFSQMVSQLFQHLFLNNSFLSTHLKCHFYDILKYFVELGVVLLLLCYSSDLSIRVLEKQFKRHSILPKSLLLPLSNFIYPLSAMSMSCFSSLLNVKVALPTTFTTCISHFKGTASPFLHNVCFHTCPQGRCLGKGKRVLSIKRQNTERGREGGLGSSGSKGIQYSLRPFEYPVEDFQQCQELRKVYVK